MTCTTQTTRVSTPQGTLHAAVACAQAKCTHTRAHAGPAQRDDAHSSGKVRRAPRAANATGTGAGKCACVCALLSRHMHAQGDLASFCVAPWSLKNSATTGVVHSGLLAEERPGHSQSKLDVLPDGGTRAGHSQCLRSSGLLQECGLLAAGLFKSMTGDGSRECRSQRRGIGDRVQILAAAPNRSRHVPGTCIRRPWGRRRVVHVHPPAPLGTGAPSPDAVCWTTRGYFGEGEMRVARPRDIGIFFTKGDF